MSMRGRLSWRPLRCALIISLSETGFVIAKRLGCEFDTMTRVMRPHPEIGASHDRIRDFRLHDGSWPVFGFASGRFRPIALYWSTGPFPYPLVPFEDRSGPLLI